MSKEKTLEGVRGLSSWYESLLPPSSRFLKNIHEEEYSDFELGNSFPLSL
jgi:hypothetical protein